MLRQIGLPAAFIALALTAASASAAPYSYANPKPLPPPSGATVTVSTVSQLSSAVQNIQNGQTILVSPGTYNIASVGDALYVRQGASNWSIRGSTGNRADVILQGNGMNGTVAFGFWIGSATRGTIADLTIRNVRDHGIIANYGAQSMLFHNLRVVDTGDQFLKSNPQSAGVGNDNGVVEYSVFEYTTNEANAGSSPGYTNGVDVHGGDGWTVQYNLFRNILHAPGAGLAGPAVLMWNGSSNTTVKGNVFVNCARAISLGLIDQSGFNDHANGLVANNFIFRDAALSSETDVPVFVADSPGTKIIHNTVLDLGSYPNAVEYRFASTTGLAIKNNLFNHGIAARDGASGQATNNLLSATAALFVSPAAGDLHLKASASQAIDKISPAVEVPADIDEETRPQGGNGDYGADELSVGAPDTLPPGVPTNLRAQP